MAMQTGISSSKVLILMGAGLTGSVILRSGRLSDVISELQELIKGINEVEISSHYDSSLLAAQVRRLAQEVRDLTLSRPITIVNGHPSPSGNLGSYVLPAAALGAMGYCYMWWKGWSFSDVMFVTKNNMSNAVASVSKQLEQVSAAVSSTRRYLTQRLEILNEKVDDQAETSKVILNEVNEVKSDLSQIGFDIEAIHNMVTDLEGKVGLIESKQEYVNAGIWYLCQATGAVSDGQNAKQLQSRYPPSSNSLEHEDFHTFRSTTVDPVEPGNLKQSSILKRGFFASSAGSILSETITSTSILHKSHPREGNLYW
ncbi:unnamed protein product [Spirodela intermedia]|uniref:DUF1664 domain-containing protein n=2 Tax=Spirodela intermedia TaxID=51605 RepID=A0A7I8LAU8_SPIIN|nr:unnamed protein product [Spirodela intermedia]CAA6670150.1 unnamed protein product [Spirodela intermedia]CAA7407201.1 unnamed protein product [Spirodela intermedia]